MPNTGSTLPLQGALKIKDRSYQAAALPPNKLFYEVMANLVLPSHL